MPRSGRGGEKTEGPPPVMISSATTRPLMIGQTGRP